METNQTNQTKLQTKFQVPEFGVPLSQDFINFLNKMSHQKWTSNKLGVILYTGDTLENCKVGFPGDFVFEQDGIYHIEFGHRAHPLFLSSFMKDFMR